jgi:DNA-binding beta-propeller fold protein YncE
MSQTLRSSLCSKKFLSGLPVIALLFSATGAFAAAPPVVVDAQFIAQTGLNGPQNLAVAPNGTYYVADAGNNRIQQYTGTTVSTVKTGTFTLVNPQAVAVDSLGDLFIGDSPTSGVGRVIEVPAPVGSSAPIQVVLGGALKDVTALTVDTKASSTTTPTTFNTLYIGDDVSGHIFSVAAGTKTLVNLGITGLPSNILPSGLAKDASGNLYIADFNSTLYEVPLSTSTTASIYSVPNFTVNGPTGLALDPKGNLYILTLTATAATPSQAIPENVIEIPGGDVDSAFLVPITGLSNGSGIGFDQSGHLYEVDFTNDNVTEVVYGAPVGLSQVKVNTVGTPVTFNYELNAATTLRGFRSISAGDTSTEVQFVSGNCDTGKVTDGSNGGAISPSDPYICQENIAAEPAYPGLRYGAVEFRGTGTTVLATTEVYSTGLAGNSVAYPLTATTSATGINSPVGLVVSGLDKKLYIANAGTGNNKPQILSANGPDAKTLSVVSTTPVTLQTPYGIAINGEGDLYIPDASAASMVVVPTVTGQTPYSFNPGGLLFFPVSVAFDTSGNLFIGDLGPGGLNNGPGDPGYIVEVPVGGGPAFKVNTPATIQFFFPGALAADPYTGDLIVGDAGDANGDGSKVVRIPAGGGGIDLAQFDGTSPSGIAFDPSDQFYVLDAVTNNLTVVQPSGNSFVVPLTSNTLLNAPDALAITNGGQNFVVANYGSSGPTADNSLIYLNGLKSTLAFGSLPVGETSPTQTEIVNSIGSSLLTLAYPYIVVDSGNHNNYFVPPNTTCDDALPVPAGTSCNVYIQFTPIDRGQDNVSATFESNGYRTAGSPFTVTGTGTR